MGVGVGEAAGVGVGVGEGAGVTVCDVVCAAARCGLASSASNAAARTMTDSPEDRENRGGLMFPPLGYPFTATGDSARDAGS